QRGPDGKGELPAALEEEQGETGKQKDVLMLPEFVPSHGQERAPQGHALTRAERAPSQEGRGERGASSGKEQTPLGDNVASDEPSVLGPAGEIRENARREKAHRGRDERLQAVVARVRRREAAAEQRRAEPLPVRGARGEPDDRAADRARRPERRSL